MATSGKGAAKKSNVVSMSNIPTARSHDVVTETRAAVGAEEAAAVAQAMIDKRTKKGVSGRAALCHKTMSLIDTKRTYKSKILGMINWLEVNYPLALDGEGQLKIPIDEVAVYNFFGMLCKAAEVKLRSMDNNDPPPMSLSAVAGFRSALVDIHKRHDIKLPPILDQRLKGLLDGINFIYSWLLLQSNDRL